MRSAALSVRERALSPPLVVPRLGRKDTRKALFNVADMEVANQPQRVTTRVVLAAVLSATIIYRSTAMTISPRHQEFYRVR